MLGNKQRRLHHILTLLLFVAFGLQQPAAASTPDPAQLTQTNAPFSTLMKPPKPTTGR